VVQEGEGPCPDDFFSILYMIRCKHEMDLECSDLLEQADTLWRELGLRDTNTLFGHSKEGLDDVDTDTWIELLMCIMIVEFINILYMNRYPIRWGLPEALERLTSHRLSPPPMDAKKHFHDSFYLATHIVYGINAYQSIPTHQRDAPWLYKFIRSALMYWMKMAWRGDKPQLKQRENKHGIQEVVDIDGVAEAVDVLRGIGMTEANDPLLTEGTQYLLRTQRKDGSWPALFHGAKKNGQHKDAGFIVVPKGGPLGQLSAYDELHPTWVATQALRDRDYKITRKGNQRWASFVDRAMKRAKFSELRYTPKWKV